MSFTIPKEVSGSFSFDEDQEEESKLINIEAREGKWVLYSTEDTKVIVDNNIVPFTFLYMDTYYILRRNEKNYLIFTENLFEENVSTYLYNKDINLLIGNTQECNIQYSCDYINGLVAKITSKENHVLLEKSENVKLYVNRKSLAGNAYYIKNGDQINIFGLKLTFFNGLLLINNPKNAIQISQTSAKISYYYLEPGQPPKNLEVKDIDLYSKDDYFSKSPRLRRVTETKEINLSPPPRQETEKDMPFILTIGPMLTMGIMSLVILLNTANKIYIGDTTFAQSWPSLVTAGAMLISMILWPVLTRRYTKKQKQKEIIEKYGKYLDEKREELTIESKLQRDILIENLITIEDCLNIIKNNSINFWDKRIDQSDFLVVRIGKGNELLDVKIKYPEEVLGEKEVIVSDTDKDAGMLYKSDKEKMFGYNTSIICENQNYVLTVDTNGSNVHDSVSFYQSTDNLLNHFDVSKIDYFVGDAAYTTPHICKTIIELGMIPTMPYTRKGYRKDYLKKYEFVYDEYNDIYICPNEKDLIPTGINKDGYIIYKADQHDCSNCPFKGHCTKGKYKQVLRHVWEGYKEMANEYRQGIKVKEIYKQRSQHIERIFADGKMKYGLRYTYFRGKERVHRELTLLYACMNLKKFALHHYV